MQLESGGFATAGEETAESTAQVLLALCAWQIDPSADPRFRKDGLSVLDALLANALPQQNAFSHRPAQPDADEMATQQAVLALLAYERLQNGQPFLFDCTDVPLTSDPVAPEPATESTAPTAPATTQTEPSVETTAEPETNSETTTPNTTATAPTATTRSDAATTAPQTSTTAARAEATPHTGDNHTVGASALLLCFGVAALALTRKKEARHAS